MLTFQEDEMHRFFDWLISNKESSQHYVPLPNGRCRVFTSMHSNLYIIFNDEELGEIEQLYHETVIMLQAEHTLLSRR
jgi:hypothetical protein